MDADLQKRLDDQDKKLEAIFRSTEKTRRLFLWTLVIAIVVTVLPLIGLLFVIPQFLQTFGDYKSILGF